MPATLAPAIARERQELQLEPGPRARLERRPGFRSLTDKPRGPQTTIFGNMAPAKRIALSGHALREARDLLQLCKIELFKGLHLWQARLVLQQTAQAPVWSIPATMRTIFGCGSMAATWTDRPSRTRMAYLAR
jgi:hypothetical protein